MKVIAASQLPATRTPIFSQRGRIRAVIAAIYNSPNMMPEGGSGHGQDTTERAALGHADGRSRRARDRKQERPWQPQIGGDEQGRDQRADGDHGRHGDRPADPNGQYPTHERRCCRRQRRQRAALTAGLPRQQPDGQQRRDRFRVGQRMQEPTVERAGIGDRRVGLRGCRGQQDRGRDADGTAQAPIGSRNQMPAAATAAPPVRTAWAPAGQRPSSPSATPVKWMNPVANTKPTA